MSREQQQGRRARGFLRVPLRIAPFVMVAACSDQTPTSATGPASAALVKGAPAMPLRHFVGLDSGVTAVPAAALAASGGRVVDAIAGTNVLVVEGATNPAALQGAGVSYVESEFSTTIDPIVGTDLTLDAVVGTAAPWYSSGVQWDMKAISADQEWATTLAGAGATVCILDSGVDQNHQEINGGKVLARRNFVTSPASETGPTIVNDLNGHGTHVAGTVAARGVVISGVAPAASLLGARVLNRASSGSATAIVNGIRWCADNGAHVINASLGGIVYRAFANFAPSFITYSSAVKYATDRGVVVVVSAGNSNLRMPNPGSALLVLPAEAPGVLTVGATGPVSKIPQQIVPGWNPFDPAQVWQGVDGKAFYSNYGTGVSVFAPGGRGSLPLTYAYFRVAGFTQGSGLDNIFSLCSSTTSQMGNVNTGGVPTSPGTCLAQTNRYVLYAGTSMAAPHVAGMAAVLYAEIGGAPSVAKRARVTSCITSTTDDIGPASTFGGGRVNVKKAVAALRSNAC